MEQTCSTADLTTVVGVISPEAGLLTALWLTMGYSLGETSEIWFFYRSPIEWTRFGPYEIGKRPPPSEFPARDYCTSADPCSEVFAHPVSSWLISRQSKGICRTHRDRGNTVLLADLGVIASTESETLSVIQECGI